MHITFFSLYAILNSTFFNLLLYRKAHIGKGMYEIVVFNGPRIVFLSWFLMNSSTFWQ